MATMITGRQRTESAGPFLSMLGRQGQGQQGLRPKEASCLGSENGGCHFFVAMDDDKGNLGISNVQTNIFLSGSHQKQGANQRDVLFSAHLSVKLPILTAHYCKN